MTYAISDIHGCYDQLVETMNSVDLENEDNKIIFLGDYIDYGESSFQVLEYIHNLQGRFGSGKVIALKGNHEAMLQEWIDEYRNIREAGDYSLCFNDWLRNDTESGYRTFRTFVTVQELEELDAISQSESFEKINAVAVKMMLNRHRDLIRWIRKFPCYYETRTSIFVHAGIDESAGKDWAISTYTDAFLWKYPPAVGTTFYKRIIAGHIGTDNKDLSNNPNFHDVFFDGKSHYYIDGSVYAKNGKLNLIAVDEDNDVVYLVDDGRLYEVLAY